MTAYKKSLKQWSIDILNRDGACVVCGSKAHLQAHHLLEKKYYRDYALELMNGVTLCCRCHCFNKFAAHTNPFWWTWWLMKNKHDQYWWAIHKMEGRVL